MSNRDDEEFYNDEEMNDDQIGDDFANFDAKRYIRERRGTRGYLGEEREELEARQPVQGRATGRNAAGRGTTGRTARRATTGGLNDEYGEVGTSRTGRAGRGTSRGSRRVQSDFDSVGDRGMGLGDLLPILIGFIADPASRSIVMGIGCLLVVACGACAVFFYLLLRG